MEQPVSAMASPSMEAKRAVGLTKQREIENMESE